VASKSFETTYIATGKAKLVYHDYPLNSHPNAIPAAEAARCAGDQQAYWQMHDALFQNQANWAGRANPAGLFARYAQEIGLDQAAFSSCLQNGTHRQAVLQARTAGDAMQLTGTPSFAVNGVLVDTTGVQSVDDIVQRLAAAVDAALAR
jgi:protein-disulfide isomerase